MSYGIRERSVLIALMALNREVANAELENKFGLGLNPAQRTRLEQDGLITIHEPRKRQHSYRLAKDGWTWVENELTVPVPKRAGSAGGGLYALLSGLHAILSARNSTLKEFFDRKALPPPSPSSLQDQICTAYRRLAARPRDWVELRNLRPLLSGAVKSEVDNALKIMFLNKEINLTLHEDQGSLTQADREAAIRVGINDMHMISMG